MELKQRILEAAIDEFQNTGLKLTMDDIAKNLKVSKKTIYKEYESKEELFFALADYSFNEIKRCEREIVENDNLSIIEKIREIIIALPERYKRISFQNLYPLKEKYPKVFKKLSIFLETDWDETIKLINKAKELNLVKDINIAIFKAMVEGSIKQFLSTNTLEENNIKYTDALNQMIDTLIEGIKV